MALKLYTPNSVHESVEEDTSWIGLDIIRPCSGKDCPLTDVCKFKQGGLCGAEQSYLRSVVDSIVKTLPPKSVDQLLLNKISLHLLPLYHQLMILKMETYSLKSVAYTNNQGSKKIVPHFKEIREIIKAIETTQKSMGLGDEYLRAKNMRGKLQDVGPDSSAPSLDGQENYYDTLFEKDKHDIQTDINPKHVKESKWKIEERKKTGEKKRWGKHGRPRNFLKLKYKGYVCRCVLDKELRTYSGIVIGVDGKQVKDLIVVGENEIIAEDYFREKVDEILNKTE